MFGLLISSLIFGGAYLSASIDNAKMMKSPYKYLKDGTPVYLDRKCQQWANGEKIIATYDYKNQKLVYAGNKSGRVYLDPEAERIKRMEAKSEENKREAIRIGKLAYLKYDHRTDMFVTCEISTGKYIAALKRTRYKNECRKFYLQDGFEFFQCKKITEGDEGVVITLDEFFGLNVIGGSHTTYGY